jgi:hypothetical protein
MGLHTSGHTRKKSSFSTQDEHLVLLGLEALTDGPQPPLRDTLYLEAVWKQSPYTRRGYVIYRARLRTDLLDTRSLDMLLEISKRLIY